jgi:DNA modification methylase
MKFEALENLIPIKRRVFHPYFTSQPHSVVSEYIKFFTNENETVLDCYSGSGVTLLESRLQNRHSVGVDLSPLACFISKVSTSKYDIDELSEEFIKIESDIKSIIESIYSGTLKKINKKKYWLPENVALPSNSDVSNLYDLFTENNFNALVILINRLNKISNENTRDFFRGIFSGILHRASRTFFYDKLNWGGGNSSIFTKYRYWVPPKPDERNVWDLFETRYRRIFKLVKDLNSGFPEKFSPKVINESATNIKSVKNESIDYVYIDPPYGGNITYLDLSTIWHAWLGFELNKKDFSLEVIEGGDIKNSKSDYTDLLKQSIGEIHRVLKTNKFLSIAFSHKDLSYWYHILNGCESAGFEYVNTIYYSPYYNSFQKIRNPLSTLTGQLILNFKKTKNPKKIKQQKNIKSVNEFIVEKVKKIISRRGDSKTEIIFNDLLPLMLESGLLKDNQSKINVIKLLSDNFMYNNNTCTWSDSKPKSDELIKIIPNKLFGQIVLKFPKINNEEALNKIDPLINLLYDRLDNNGVLWVICDNVKTGKSIFPVAYILSEKFQKKGFYVQNNIIWPHMKNDKHVLSDAHSYILFLTKDAKKYNFSKDPIREVPIWKNIEWGKRSFRYNEKGKDPGNVWLPTLDNGAGKITKHLFLKYHEVLDRIILTSQVDKEILIISDEVTPKLKNINHKIETVLYDSIVPNNAIQEILIKKSTNKHIDTNISTEHKVFFSNSENLNNIKNKSINLIVTSPPYWDLKNYDNENQIGFKENYHEYLKRMEIVWRECIRVLKDDGTFWININSRKVDGVFYAIHLDFIKSLSKLGFTLIETIIWHKSSGIPVGDTNFTDRFEYILGFVKSNAKSVIVNEMELVDYKNDELPTTPINVWNMNRISGSLTKGLEHPAMFPEELPKRIIQMFTKPGDTIFDPFLGSGTSMVAAIETFRNSIGYELNISYKPIISKKIDQAVSQLFFSNAKIEYNK